MSRSFKTATKELIIFLFFIIFPILVRAESFEFQNLFLIPGRVEGEGTYFEIKKSEYLNISLKSDKKIKVILESMPKLISLMIEESKENGAEKANLIIENLEPNKIYYKYEDSYKNVVEVYSGNEGKYEWEQDLSKSHHIWFQEEKSTIFLPRDCSNYGNWDISTQTCILNQDLNQSVEIYENNITLDCANYNIIGNGEGYGIYLNSKTGITIKNCKVRNFVRGLSLSSSNNNKFENNTFSNNWAGIYLHASYNNEFRENIIENNSWCGFTLDYYSQNNILRENQMQNNKFNFLSFGYENDIDTTNLVDGKPIYYLIDASNITLDSSSNAGTVHCIRCSNITIKDLNLKNNFFGIFLSNSKNSKIEGNKIEENNIGIYLSNSQGILVTENTMINNYSDIYLDSSNENLLEKNTIQNEISDNNSGGIVLSSSNNNTLSGNSFFKKGIVISCSSRNILDGNNISNSPYGISIALSSENNIFGNFLSENSNGIYLNWSSKNILKNNKIEKSRFFGFYLYNSGENLVTQNTLIENTTGIFSLDSAKNSIYHNNFIDNQTQANTNNQENFFDNGYPEGGNYWSDYAGKDEKSGPEQDQEGPDGIGDSPYCFYNDCDQYPLMGKKEENLISQKWEFDVNFQYNLDENLETIEGQGEGKGEISLSQNELKIEGVFSLNGKFPTQIPKISLIDTDGFKKELSSSTISFDTISYSQAGSNSYHFSLSISNPPRPENNGHYELYLEIEGNPFFINTVSKINKNYLPLIIFQNQPPTPIIEFFPKLPVKGTKVKFDGAKSFDFDGEIVSFEWQIVSSTFYGTTTEFTFDENGEYQIILTVTDENGATSSTSTIIKVEPFSFVLITDLHIGWGIPDYNGEGYNDQEEGQDYYMTERLKMVVEWINDNYERENIKFVVIDGDISDTAEYSEFLKAREILNQLKIPYIPLIGNHDIWPNTQKLTTDPDGLGGRWNTIKEKRKEGEPLGDEYFEKIFWQDNATNTSMIKSLFDNFERQEEIPQYQGPPYFQNYSFHFGGTTFIALDFNAREADELLKTGKTTTRVHDETLNWLEEKLKENKGRKVIVFVHQPLVGALYFTKLKLDIEPLINKYCKCKPEECNCKIFNFAGHVHWNRIVEGEYNVIETEALLESKVPWITRVIGTEPAPSGRFMRLVQISGNGTKDIDYNRFVTGFPKAINPFITTNKEEPAVGESITFYAHTKNLKPEEILSYEWDFDKNYSSQCVFPEDKYSQCLVTYNQPGTYKVSLKIIPKDDPSDFEKISWNLKIKEEAKPRWKIFLPIPGITPLLNGNENVILTEQDNAQNTPEWVMITKVTSPAKPVGVFEVHFENTNQDIDLSNLIADINLDTKKSILFMPEWPKEIENSKVLFLPISQ